MLVDGVVCEMHEMLTLVSKYGKWAKQKTLIQKVNCHINIHLINKVKYEYALILLNIQDCCQWVENIAL